VSAIGSQIQVGEGVVSRAGDGIRFAGSYIFPASNGQPITIEITVWDKSTAGENKVTLREGETFQIAGQTWRLDKIYEDPRRWCADLTRIA
jgi:Family of unknown function (DUF6406)